MYDENTLCKHDCTTFIAEIFEWYVNRLMSHVCTYAFI